MSLSSEDSHQDPNSLSISRNRLSLTRDLQRAHSFEDLASADGPAKFVSRTILRGQYGGNFCGSKGGYDTSNVPAALPGAISQPNSSAFYSRAFLFEEENTVLIEGIHGGTQR